MLQMYFYFVFAIMLMFKCSKKAIIPSLIILLVVFFVLRKMEIGAEFGFVNYVTSLISRASILFFICGVLLSILYEKYKEILAE